MKHVQELDYARRLLEEAGVELSEEVLVSAISHTLWVVSASQHTNLTAIRESLTAIRLHLVDSLCSLPEIDAAPPGPLCDMGTGGGFPGLPLSIATGRTAVLVDSVSKKAKLVQQYIEENHLDSKVTAVGARLESLARERAGDFAVVTARAVAPLPVLCELAAPLLGSGGHLIALKGDLSTAEHEAGLRAGEIVGLELVSRRDYVLPEGGEKRAVVALRKARQPSIALPRRDGVAQKRPLA